MAKKRSALPKKRPNSDLPPPGHPIDDVSRMTSIIPPRPDEPNAILEKLFGKGKTQREVIASISQSPPRQQAPSPPRPPSPLDHLHQTLLTIFIAGDQSASVVFTTLKIVSLEGRTHITLLDHEAAACSMLGITSLPWNSCKLAATLVLLLAAPNDRDIMYSALKNQSRSMGGLPTMAMINATPPADLPARFAKAKKDAIDGKLGKVTILAVTLVDVEMIERGEVGGKPMLYSSFAHAFVLGVAREGWRLFQSWGEYGYTLSEWLRGGGARLRGWEEGKRFVGAFRGLVEARGKWTQQVNDWYLECFEVNILRICGKKGPQKPIVPIYRPGVRIFELEDVKVADIEKFTWYD
ncbi:hypothetical protein N7G274_005644 [Stereocaulon virgatum]|uniref:Uncharacterized protein n=1 Tax=Stereocaulon virgatum TaxID=373712 RepID=A0ABR4A8N4_9LECA